MEACGEHPVRDVAHALVVWASPREGGGANSGGVVDSGSGNASKWRVAATARKAVVDRSTNMAPSAPMTHTIATMDPWRRTFILGSYCAKVISSHFFIQKER